MAVNNIGVSVGSLPWSELNWFIFLLRLGGRKLYLWMIKESALCPILPQNYKTTLCIMRISAMTVWRVSISFLMEVELIK